MPRAPKMCGQLHCINLVRDQVYCPEHQKPRTPSSKHTGGRNFRMVVRPAVLKRDNHVCQIQGPRCTQVADQVDHIVQISDGGVDDPAGDRTYTNCRSVCGPCHRAKTGQDAAAASALSEIGIGEERQPRMTYVPPGAARPIVVSYPTRIR